MEEAQKILAQIESIIQRKDMGYYHMNQRIEESKNTQNWERTPEGMQSKILLLSKQLFELIPISSFLDGGAPKPVDKQNLMDFKNKVYDLTTMERASRILLGAQY